MSDMSGKRVLITGATAGIGKQTALELLGMGAEVIVVGRNPEKTQSVIEELKQTTGKDHISSLLADLSSMKSIRALAADFLAKFDRLDVLINNAGGFNRVREETVDGYERTFATNHLAYFLLSQLLLPALERAPAPRIINLSSDGHKVAALDLTDLQATRGYNEWWQYGRTKLCNIYFTRELSRRVADKGITVNAVHPGFIASDFLSKGGLWNVFKPVAYLFAKSIPRGARTSVYLASSPEVAGVTGKYFYNCKPAKVRRFKNEEDAAVRLWDESERLVASSA
jgi:NAD(P)-dependent dehydrogenase (short-subunit alcohol dehydrogenase family)